MMRFLVSGFWFLVSGFFYYQFFSSWFSVLSFCWLLESFYVLSF